MLVVALTDLSRATDAERALKSAFRGDDRVTESVIRFAKVTHNFSDLMVWRSRLVPELVRNSEIVRFGVDYARNRIEIGSEAPDHVRALLPVVAGRVSVPLTALLVTEARRPVMRKSLISKFRPTEGGVIIRRPGSGGSSPACSLGFNADLNGVSVLITAAHCTANVGQNDASVFYQPTTTLGSSRIGQEYSDPPLLFCTGGPPDSCRWSDAVAVKYDAPSDGVKGYIARTISRSSSLASVTIDPNQPNIQVTSKKLAPLQGEVLDKVGHVSGWTYGTVTRTCYYPVISNSKPDGTGTSYRVLCQDYVAAANRSGDSGSPVFKWNSSTGTATLYGILWGGGDAEYIFSAVENLETDFGASLDVIADLTPPCEPGLPC
jgi:hypothetical protein